MIYIYRRFYYSALKKNEIVAFAGKWMELENIMLSKINQTPKNKGQIFSDMQKLIHSKQGGPGKIELLYIR